MSVLRSLESKIADLVEGAFGRAFRSEITAVELGRRLVREMDRHRQSSLSSTVVPNEYVVWLSPADHRQFAQIEASLIEELSAHLLEHARAEKLALPSRPHIELRTDRDLSLGECGIEASIVSAPPAVARRYGVPPPPPPDDDRFMAPAERPPLPPAPPDGGRFMAPAERPSRPPAPIVAGEVLAGAWLDVEGRRVAIGAGGTLIGRSSESDIVIAVQEVSRRHAQIVPQNDGWLLVDLNSTNGVRLNGHPLAGAAPLSPGDVIEIGTVELVFEVG
jgi:Protein of unknown function (DUF3662)/FHA domain